MSAHAEAIAAIDSRIAHVSGAIDIHESVIDRYRPSPTLVAHLVVTLPAMRADLMSLQASRTVLRNDEDRIDAYRRDRPDEREGGDPRGARAVRDEEGRDQ